MYARQLDGLEGSNLPERARTAITRGYENTLGRSATDVELIPFESVRPGTWRWKAPAPVAEGHGVAVFPTKIIVDLSPDGVAVVTVALGDEEGLARRVIETLKTTHDPECYFTMLEGMLKTGLGVR